MEINRWFDEDYQDEKEEARRGTGLNNQKGKLDTEILKKKIFKEACHLEFLLCFVFVSHFNKANTITPHM